MENSLDIRPRASHLFFDTQSQDDYFVDSKNVCTFHFVSSQTSKKVDDEGVESWIDS